MQVYRLLGHYTDKCECRYWNDVICEGGEHTWFESYRNKTSQHGMRANNPNT
jgi:hypothetical protein